MFTEDDLAKYRTLKLIIGQSDISIKGNAIEKAGEAFKWFNDLEKKLILLKDAIDKEKAK